MEFELIWNLSVKKWQYSSNETELKNQAVKFLLTA